MLDVRDCIEPAIEKSGMKKIFVAEKAGLSQQQMSDIIGKRRRLDSNELMRICNALHITPNEMLGLGVIHEGKPRLPEGSKEQSELPDGRGREVRKSGGSENNSG